MADGRIVISRNPIQALLHYIYVFFRAIYLFFKTLFVVSEEGGMLTPDCGQAIPSLCSRASSQCWSFISVLERCACV